MSAAVAKFYRLDGEELCRAKAGLVFALDQLGKATEVSNTPTPDLAGQVDLLRTIGHTLSIMEYPRLADMVRQVADDIETALS